MAGCAERIAIAAFALTALGARADIFSPGPLSKAHAKLEGLSNCTKCHVAGAQLSAQRCLDCHTEIEGRMAQHAGFHGRLPPAEQACNKCHLEHQGRDFALVDWGPAGRAAFDHARTGFSLTGAHAKLRCEQCHSAALIADPAVRALGRETFLGASVRCSACHADEHRSQLRSPCQDCHVTASWKPAPGFDHARASFALAGKHRSVECLQCHAKTRDAKGEFARFKPIAHASCTDCHKDPHENRFGQGCAECHTVEGWQLVKQAAASGARAFHAKTRFPLQGAHAGVACKSCHGPFPGQRAVFKGLRFESCASCHVDAHLGQLGPTSCDRCHTVQGFLPARYHLADHKRYPLEGAHAAVACNECHRRDEKLAARASPIRAWLERRGRHDRVSLAQFHPRAGVPRCDSCHADPHGGQFAPRVAKAGCADCHEVSGFSRVSFDHDRESRFHLAGKHAALGCGACHSADASGSVRYKPLETSCAACHADPHLAQFGAPADCAKCHASEGWKPASFAHRPPFTPFELDGAHASVACGACHREVAVAPGATARRYQGVPTSCEGCHADVHRGAFKGFAP
jgi:hypothetical protein